MCVIEETRTRNKRAYGAAIEPVFELHSSSLDSDHVHFFGGAFCRVRKGIESNSAPLASKSLVRQPHVVGTRARGGRFFPPEPPADEETSLAESRWDTEMPWPRRRVAVAIEGRYACGGADRATGDGRSCCVGVAVAVYVSHSRRPRRAVRCALAECAAAA